MAGKKRVRFESWKYPHREDQARALIKNMLDMGSPVVDRGGVMSWLLYDDQLGISTQPMSKDNLLAEINMTTDYLVQKWEKAVDHNGNAVLDPEYKEPVSKLYAVIGDVHHRAISTAYGLPAGRNGLWKLRGALTHPIINAHGQYVMRNGLRWQDADVNGMTAKAAVIHLADGYDPVSQYFFAVPERVSAALEGIQGEKPVEDDVAGALEFLDWFLCDFTFATPSAKASAVAFMLTMVCREIIRGNVPMLEVRAAVSHSGKSLLVKMSIGGVTGVMPVPFSPNFRDTGEFEKELFSLLFQGRSYIFMDDVSAKVQSSFLDMAITTGFVEKRLLGMNATARVYSGMPFVMTANNPSMSDDMKNRVYLLDILKPEDGKKFVHELPEKEAVELQPQLLRALFTLYNHWDKNEKRKPFTERRMDGFIEWSRTVGGILQAAGIPGFLDDTMKQIKEVDPKLEQAAGMARPWFEENGCTWLYVKETFKYALEAGYVKETDSAQEKIQKIAARLARLRMAPLPGGYRFERNDDESRGSQWRVFKNAGN